MTLEYERKTKATEETQEIKMGITQNLMNFLQDMHQQINTSNHQHKVEIITTIQASGKFISETVNVINATFS
jgi:hypothetical protein